MLTTYLFTTTIFRRRDVKLDRLHSYGLFKFTWPTCLDCGRKETHVNIWGIKTKSKHKTTCKHMLHTERPPLVGSQNIPAVRLLRWTLNQPWRYGYKYRRWPKHEPPESALTFIMSTSKQGLTFLVAKIDCIKYGHILWDVNHGFWPLWSSMWVAYAVDDIFAMTTGPNSRLISNGKGDGFLFFNHGCLWGFAH